MGKEEKRIITVKELMQDIISKIESNQDIEFSFAVEFLPDASDGTGWYGVKYPIRLFDEQDGLFSIGYFGGGGTKTFEIERDSFHEEGFEEFLLFYFAMQGIGNEVLVSYQ